MACAALGRAEVTEKAPSKPRRRRCVALDLNAISSRLEMAYARSSRAEVAEKFAVGVAGGAGAPPGRQRSSIGVRKQVKRTFVKALCQTIERQVAEGRQVVEETKAAEPLDAAAHQIREGDEA